VVILILGTALFVRAARAGGWRLIERAAGRGLSWSDPGTRNLVLAMVLCLGYAAGLVGRMPFWLATFLFVSAFVAAFEWRRARSRTERLQRVAFAAVFAGAISAAVTLVFQEIFLVPLP
jgi:hypothetical protein